ncbi:MAG: hypothetical protein H7177_05275 [Rhizobacter sp.]|nr:hypothetical protein [Bacteriovorax sp.]
MNKLKMLSMITTLCFSSTLLADSGEKTIDQKLGSLKLEKMQAEAMVATMVRRGHINDGEAARIKREIASVKEQDVEVIKAEALENFDSKNSFATK